ncbi:MAG: lysophospholipid acyltransferase family protein [Chthoniobacteraceae bacterium]
MGLTYAIGYNLTRLIARTFFGFRVHGRENMIEEGGCILAMNHESYLDPPLAGSCCHRQIHYLGRRTLMKWPILGPLFPLVNVIPVDQERADMSALKAVIKLVRAGHCTVVFPEGSRTPDGSLQPAQPGLGLIIAKTLCPVVPMRVFGARAAFPRGGTPRFFKRIQIVVDKPIYFQQSDLDGQGRELYQKLSERVMERIAAIHLP